MNTSSFDHKFCFVLWHISCICNCVNSFRVHRKERTDTCSTIRSKHADVRMCYQQNSARGANEINAMHYTCSKLSLIRTYVHSHEDVGHQAMTKVGSCIGWCLIFTWVTALALLRGVRA